MRFPVTTTALVPDPIDHETVELYVDNPLLVPHSNHAVVARPFGFTEPFNVAVVCPICVADVDVTVGNGALSVETVIAFEFELVPLLLTDLTR